MLICRGISSPALFHEAFIAPREYGQSKCEVYRRFIALKGHWITLPFPLLLIETQNNGKRDFDFIAAFVLRVAYLQTK